MTTIKDVAKKAGVGIATVSRFINKNGYVSEETAEKITIAMDELKYYPNAAARLIKSNKSYTIALLIPSISNAFFPELASAIEDRLHSLGYKMILCNVNEDKEREEKYVDMILENRVDGVISSTGFISQKLYDSNLPIVSMDRLHKVDSRAVTVMSDHYGGAVQATKHLIEKGCKNILHLHGSFDNEPAVSRNKAFQDVCENMNVKYTSMPVESELDVHTLRQFDGVFVWTDIDAIRFMSTCIENGIKVPDDIKVIGFDGIDLSSLVYPRLTTIKQPIKELGETACDMLFQMIQTNNYNIQNRILKTVLEERDTTKGE